MSEAPDQQQSGRDDNGSISEKGPPVLKEAVTATSSSQEKN